MTTNGGDDGADQGADDVGPFDIYETADGPRHVGSPVRRLILRKMRGAELTVPEMIAATGLTKSTISTHVGVLHKEGMVAYREDPQDRRRKFYYLTARHVGTTRRCTDRLPIAAEDLDGAPDVMGRLVLRALLAELACCGLDLAPLVRETGRRVGELMADGTVTKDVAAWADQTARLWSEAGLGRLHIEPGESPTIRVRSCGLCFAGADPRMSLCAITQGILEGMAAQSLQTAVELQPLPPVTGPTEDAKATATPRDDGQGGADADGCGCMFRVLLATAPVSASDRAS